MAEVSFPGCCDACGLVLALAIPGCCASPWLGLLLSTCPPLHMIGPFLLIPSASLLAPGVGLPCRRGLLLLPVFAPPCQGLSPAFLPFVCCSLNALLPPPLPRGCEPPQLAWLSCGLTLGSSLGCFSSLLGLNILSSQLLRLVGFLGGALVPCGGCS